MLKTTITIVVGSLFLFSLSCLQSVEFDTISKYTDYDLRKLDRRSTIHFRNLLKKNTPKDRIRDHLVPWYVWRAENSHGDKRIVVISINPLSSIPGHAHLNIDLFDCNLKYINSSYFQTGNRMDVRKVKLYRTNFGAYVIQVKTTYLFKKSIIMQQYYGLIGDRIALVRAEDRNKHLIRLVYAWGHPFGPSVPACDINRLERSLKSGSELEILESLVWLSGVHADLLKMKTSMKYEKKRHVMCFEELYERISSNNILDTLANSGNKWVEEAAALAKTKEYDWLIEVD